VTLLGGGVRCFAVTKWRTDDPLVPGARSIKVLEEDVARGRLDVVERGHEPVEALELKVPHDDLGVINVRFAGYRLFGRLCR